MCRYVRLNALNVLHVPQPCFIAPNFSALNNLIFTVDACKNARKILASILLILIHNAFFSVIRQNVFCCQAGYVVFV